jgi:hypothetical protein
MPVHVITKNGRRYYQWGNHGKVYPTRAEAEAQGRAIEASKQQQMKDGKK